MFDFFYDGPVGDRGSIHHSVTVFDGGTRRVEADDICAKFLAGDLMEIVEQMRHIRQCNLPFYRPKSVCRCAIC